MDAATAALEAFATGWESTGAPLGDRFAPRAEAAVLAASGHGPGALETTLVIGQLEGTWALVFDRRDRLIARHVRKAVRAWRDATTDLDVRGLVRSYRHPGRLPGASDLALDLAAFVAGWLREVLMRPEWATLAQVTQDAIRAAMAEGESAALALAAAGAGLDGFDAAAAFRDAHDRLETLPALAELAMYWAERMLTGAGTDTARALAKLAADGTEAQMVTAVEDALREARSARFYAAQAMHTGFAHGAIALYEAEGVAELSWITAGDSHVCSTCDGYEADSPYLIAEFPEMPAHGGCRCVPGPSGDFMPARLADYLAA